MTGWARAGRAGVALGLACAIAWSGCGSAPRGAVASAIDRGEIDEAFAAYERMRASDGPDLSLLGMIAALVLDREARSDDRDARRAAVQELTSAGTAGDSTLRSLATSAGPVRVIALEALARRGDDRARIELRALADDEDADARAAAILGMDAVEDRALLLEAMASPQARARENAAERLGGAAPDTDARLALENAARVDPEAGVRIAAVRALGGFGSASVGALRERLGDPVAGVRMSAVEALLRADRDQARDILGALLATPTSAQGIEAARLLATPGAGATTPDDPGARTYLRQALLASDPNLRSQAGVALVSLPGSEEYLGVLREALAREADPGAKLSIARALLRQRGAETEAREALRALAAGGPTMTSLQAAAILAGERDGDAAHTIAGFLGAPDPMLRRTAARALARDAMRPDDVRSALRDHDATVRIGAAGGILAALAASAS